jgi:hypothetical protein
MNQPKDYRTLIQLLSLSTSLAGICAFPHLEYMWAAMAMVSIGGVAFEIFFPYWVILDQKKQGMVVKKIKTSRAEIEFEHKGSEKQLERSIDRKEEPLKRTA